MALTVLEQQSREGSVQGSSVVKTGPVPSAFNLIPFVEKDLGVFVLFEGLFYFFPFILAFPLSSLRPDI